MTFTDKQFQEYMLAKDALNKLMNCANYDEKIELTPQECRALFSQKIIDVNENLGMLT